MEQGPSANHRSGFVALAGRPNVGKSTLINALLGQMVAAVSPKPQTTRRSQLGILSRPDAQVIFIDTPGLHKPHHKLGALMNIEATQPLEEADLILLLFDASEEPSDEDKRVLAAAQERGGGTPRLAAANKIDLVTGDLRAARLAAYQALAGETEVMPISAATGENLPALEEAIITRLSRGPRYYPDEQITDTYARDLAADLIRAAAMTSLRDEVPYSIAVRIDTFKERETGGAYIEATLFVERESQKGIVIGKGGEMAKRIGSLARQRIEALIGRATYLKLRVKVLPGWRNDVRMLKRFGFRAPPE